MKTDLFQSCDHCWVFQICWHIECNTFTASSFRIWNSSTGIPSPPLATKLLFVVMLSKTHLTSHSRMSGSRRVMIPSWLSGSWSSFSYSSRVYSCYLFLISSQARSDVYIGLAKSIDIHRFSHNRTIIGFMMQLTSSLCFIISTGRAMLIIQRHFGLSWINLQYK